MPNGAHTNGQRISVNGHNGSAKALGRGGSRVGEGGAGAALNAWERPLEAHCSTFDGARHGGAPMSCQSVRDAVRASVGPTLKAKIKAIRGAKDPAKQKALKWALPADTLAYWFDGSPSKANATDLERVTGILSLDFDDVQDAGAVLLALKSDPRVVAAFRSARGEGLRVLVRWEPSTDLILAGGGESLWREYAAAEERAFAYFRETHGMDADGGARGIYRLSFRSWDPAGFIVEDAAGCEPFSGQLESANVEDDKEDETRVEHNAEDLGAAALMALEDQQELAQLRGALSWIDPTFAGGEEIADDIPNSRATWVRIGIAIKNKFPAGCVEAYGIFHQWSRNELRRKGAEWKKGPPETFGSEEEFNHQWHSFVRDQSGEKTKLGLGLIYKIARAKGWSRVGEDEESLPDAENWEDFLRRNDKGTVKNCDWNADLILQYHPKFAGLIRWNGFLLVPEVSDGIEWAKDREQSRAWTDHDDIAASLCMTRLYAPAIFEVQTIARVIVNVAKKSQYHPIRDWLRGLKWDGVKRLDKWLSRVFGCDPGQYTNAVGAKTLIAAVARVESPGCKVDTTLIISGHQGIGKSTVFRELAGKDWFSDADLPVGTKDAAMQTRGVWIYELGELHVLRRAEVTALKGYLSRQTDKQRDAFERHVKERLRQNVFVGTTNREQYLTDDTGNRRFWPIRAKRADTQWITDNREQLWAEAHARWAGGEVWWLDKETDKLAYVEQEKRVEHEPYMDMLESFLNHGGKHGMGEPTDLTHTVDLLEHLKLHAPEASHYRRIAIAMTRLGWVRKYLKIGGIAKHGYRRKNSVHFLG